MKTIRVGQAMDLFLSHMADSSSPKTHKWYATFLRSFRPFAAERPLSEITPAVLARWVASQYGGQSSSTQHGAARCVRRMVNWAVAEGRLDKSPLRGYRNPLPSHREAILTGAQYAAIIKACRRQAEKDVIKFLWHTGARPQEMKAIESAWVRGPKIVFPRRGSKGKKNRRVIYLDSLAAGIVARRSDEHASGPIFRGHWGRPWSTNRLCAAVRGVGDRAGVPGLCCYVIRHTWITRLLEKGVGVATVAALAGNSPAIMLRTYAHVAENEEFLRSHLD